MSLGRAYANHKLPFKLDLVQSNGFKGIEIFYEDLEYLARDESGISASETPSSEAQVHAANTIRQLCDERSLEVIGLQPFMHYEGLIDRYEHTKRIEKLKLWFKIAKILGTDIIQIPANFLPASECTGNIDAVVADLKEVVEMGLRETPVVRFAYENLCWSTHFDTWEQGWELVEAVNTPNFGVCLDTFNLAGRVYADPASPTGLTSNAEADMQRTLAEMVRRIDVTKIFYIQVVDAERMREPLVEGHAFYDAEQPARMSWSRNARLFAFEEGGYLPVLQVLRTIVEGVGWRGWVSMELFSRTMDVEGEDVVREHARRGRVAWEKLVVEMENWNVK